MKTLLTSLFLIAALTFASLAAQAQTAAYSYTGAGSTYTRNLVPGFPVGYLFFNTDVPLLQTGTGTAWTAVGAFSLGKPFARLYGTGNIPLGITYVGDSCAAVDTQYAPNAAGLQAGYSITISDDWGLAGTDTIKVGALGGFKINNSTSPQVAVNKNYGHAELIWNGTAWKLTVAGN